jgi:hypothetical protein
METYLVAVLKFYFKPRSRLWDPEGTISMVLITAPKLTEGPQMKEYGGEAAGERLAYLAQVVDTHGWSTRGAASANDSLSDIFIAEASHAEDILDDTSPVTQDMERRINLSDDAHLEAARRQMQQLASQQQPQTAPVVPPMPQLQPMQPPAQQYGYAPLPAPAFNPYPAMHQHIVDPNGQPQPVVAPQLSTAVGWAGSAQGAPVYAAPAPLPPTKPLPETVSPDIMRLANTKDLSISALAHEAHRLEDDNQEVVVNLH